MRKSEILNTLEKMVEDLYEVGNPDAQYYEQIVGEAMDIVMEYDLWVWTTKEQWEFLIN